MSEPREPEHGTIGKHCPEALASTLAFTEPPLTLSGGNKSETSHSNHSLSVDFYAAETRLWEVEEEIEAEDPHTTTC